MGEGGWPIRTTYVIAFIYEYRLTDLDPWDRLTQIFVLYKRPYLPKAPSPKKIKIFDKLVDNIMYLNPKHIIIHVHSDRGSLRKLQMTLLAMEAFCMLMSLDPHNSRVSHNFQYEGPLYTGVFALITASVDCVWTPSFSHDSESCFFHSLLYSRWKGRR